MGSEMCIRDRLHGMGKLRIPREVELAGLDYEIMEAAKEDEKSVASASR